MDGEFGAASWWSLWLRVAIPLICFFHPSWFDKVCFEHLCVSAFLFSLSERLMGFVERLEEGIPRSVLSAVLKFRETREQALSTK